MTTEAYYSMHQKAFRAAFDFLNRNFPPGDNPEWWLTVTSDAANASLSQGENKLANCLIVGILEYLEYEYKRRQADGSTDT